VQVNLSGIVGPALGGLLLPLLGAPLLISINALTFLLVALVVLQWKPRQIRPTRLRENFAESFINSLRYALNSPSMHTILFRNLIFSLVISVVPALLPVIALKELHLSAAQLGLVFTCVGVGSLAGATIALPFLRQRMSPNAITSIAMTIMTLVLFAMVFLRQAPALMVCAAPWQKTWDQIWLAGQRVMRNGCEDAFQIMLGEAASLTGALLGTGVYAGLDRPLHRRLF
jgi:predicted MFS family arabinose efflux permease